MVYIQKLAKQKMNQQFVSDGSLSDSHDSSKEDITFLSSVLISSKHLALHT